MNRREFIAGLGGAAAWPLTARAQQQAVPVIGFLQAGNSPFTAAPSPLWRGEVTAAFIRSLSDAGYVVGENVMIEYRWAEGHYDRLPAFAADLVLRRVAVIAAVGAPSVSVAKAATATIPIVFIMGDDPVRAGLVASLNRPGGNVTGVSLMIGEVVTKRFGLLTELVPDAAIIGVLINPSNPVAETDAREAQLAARAYGRQTVLLNATNAAEISVAFATAAERGAGALLMGSDILFSSQSAQLVALADRHRIAAMYPVREEVVDGGLVSYGSSATDAFRLAAGYTARILKGEKPTDLPVVQPSKFELAINLKTARALGLTVPPNLLAIADEVIE